MSSPSESRTGQLQVKHKQHHMYKKMEGSKRWHSIRAIAAAVLTLPNSAIIENRPCRRMVTLSCLPRRYPALAAFGGSCPLSPDSGHTWRLLQCLVTARNCWRHLAPALGASRFVRARMRSSTADASRHVLLTSCHILERVAALVERCSPRGTLRPLWSAAVAMDCCGRYGALRSTLSAAVHAERCGPR